MSRATGHPNAARPRSHPSGRTDGSLRPGFDLKSGDFDGCRAGEIDLLVVLEHDWKACPVRVIELQQVLWPGELRG